MSASGDVADHREEALGFLDEADDGDESEARRAQHVAEGQVHATLAVAAAINALAAGSDSSGDADWPTSRLLRPPSAGRTVNLLVRRRDGDQCRHCGSLVTWRGGAKCSTSGAYTNLPADTETSVETMFVACYRCWELRRDFLAPLLDAPDEPVYSALTLSLLGQVTVAEIAQAGLLRRLL